MVETTREPIQSVHNHQPVSPDDGRERREGDNSRITGDDATPSPSRNAPKDFAAIAALVEKLNSDDTMSRVEATKMLCVIAKALGPERAREELIPFICDSSDDDDEVLVVAAEELGKMVNLLGGNEYAYLLLGPLEPLVAEDLDVREVAIESFLKVLKDLPDADRSSKAFPCLERLAEQTFFTARISACELISRSYGDMPPSIQPGMRQIFAKLCHDDSPVVRRSAASTLAQLVQGVTSSSPEFSMEPKDKGSVLANYLFELLDLLAQDKQDSVRLQAMGNCKAFSEAFAACMSDDSMRLSHYVEDHILPVALATVTDRSWRVRWSAADSWNSICEILHEWIRNPAETLGGAFELLMQDCEAEVRAAAAENITKVYTVLGKDAVVGKIISFLQNLVLDSCDYVRTAIAGEVCGLSKVLGQTLTVKYLLPILFTLLRDVNSQVRLRIITEFDKVSDVVGIELTSQSLLPAVIDLAADTKWRVRLAIIKHIPYLAKELGEAFFSEKLSQLCMAWMSDDVHLIRTAAAENMKNLLELLGEEWVKSNILPKVTFMYQHSTFGLRMTAVYTLQALTSSLSQNVLQEDILPLVLDMTADSIPNIRFNSVKVLAAMAPRLPPGIVEAKIKPSLSTLANDKDVDVRFFTKKAMIAIEP